MKRIVIIVRKEFLQIFRNKSMLPIIFFMPVIQLLILSFAADYEIKSLKLFIVDQDHSNTSRLLHSKFQSTGYFKIVDIDDNIANGELALENNKADILLEIPPDLGKNLIREGKQKIQLIINGIDGAKAGISMIYVSQIIADFNRELIQLNAMPQAGLTLPRTNYRIDVNFSNWYNPELNYQTFMVPGILVLLITMIGAFLSSMNIVREKEIGTIEQINVTPIHKYEFIIGKLLPFWLLALVELTIGLIVAKIIFDLPFVGNILVIYGFAGIYLLLILGMGLLISTLTNTQQQAMFISWFFLVIFILMSGLFTAIVNMPVWAQKVTLLNPVRYFIEVVRMVLLKGSGFQEISSHLLIVFSYSVVLISLAVWRYRKNS